MSEFITAMLIAIGLLGIIALVSDGLKSKGRRAGSD